MVMYKVILNPSVMPRKGTYYLKKILKKGKSKLYEKLGVEQFLLGKFFHKFDTFEKMVTFLWVIRRLFSKFSQKNYFVAVNASPVAVYNSRQIARLP